MSFIISNPPKRLSVNTTKSKINNKHDSVVSSTYAATTCPLCKQRFSNLDETKFHILNQHQKAVEEMMNKNRSGTTTVRHTDFLMERNSASDKTNNHHHTFDHDDENDSENDSENDVSLFINNSTNDNNNDTSFLSPSTSSTSPSSRKNENFTRNHHNNKHHRCDVCSSTSKSFFIDEEAPAKSTIRPFVIVINNNNNTNNISDRSSTTATIIIKICNDCIHDKFDLALKSCSLEPLKCFFHKDDQQYEHDDNEQHQDGRFIVITISEANTVGVITSSSWEKLHSKIMNKYLESQLKEGNYVKCPSCSFVVEKPVGVGMIDNDDDDSESNNDNSNNRVRCTQCSTVFCCQCLASPFHDGLSCKKFKQKEESLCCRFCSEIIVARRDEDDNNVDQVLLMKEAHSSSSLPAAIAASSSSSPSSSQSLSLLLPIDVCRTNSECFERAKNQCCPITLPCGHPCYFASPFHDSEQLREEGGGQQQEQNDGRVNGGNDVNHYQVYHNENRHYCLQPDCKDFRTIVVMSSNNKNLTTSMTADDSQKKEHHHRILVSQDTNKDDWCSICYCDTLAGGSPVVRLNCGHIFHLDCVKRKLAAKWPGPRVSFGFLSCANCNQDMDARELHHYDFISSLNNNSNNNNNNIRHIKDDDKKCDDVDDDNNPSSIILSSSSTSLLDKILNYRSRVRKLMLERLRFEELHNHSEITQNKSGRFYQKPELFAEHTFAFYPCFKCGDPFYGGHNRCEAIMLDENDENNQEEEEKQKFNPKDLLCASCADDDNNDDDEQDGKNNTNRRSRRTICPVHGSSFMLFKCKFCCNVAAFFCWGTTHFCASCHHTQEGGRYLNKLPLEELPQCPGVEKCPLKIPHPRNGTAEFPLGCALCK